MSEDIDYDMCPRCGSLNAAVNEAIHGWYYSCHDCSNTWFIDAALVDAKSNPEDEEDDCHANH